MPDRTPPIQNPAQRCNHVFRGSNACVYCGEVVINPILSFEDERLKNAEPLSATRIAEAVLVWPDLYGLIPCPLDYLLMEMASGLEIPFADYVLKVGAAYEDMPPHTKVGEWWNE
jgi:hypothetical protein